MKCIVLPPAAGYQPAARGKTDRDENSGPTKPDLNFPVKSVSALIVWPVGLSGPITIAPQGGSDLVDDQIFDLLEQALKPRGPEAN